MLRLRILTALVAAPLLLAAPAVIINATPSYASEQAEQSALKLVEGLGQKAVEALANNKLSVEEKREQFSVLVNSNFDMRLIGRFVLGKHWRKANEQEREEFLDLFNTYIITTYQKRIGEYSGENLKILKARSLNDKEYIVNSEIIRPAGPAIKLDWRLRNNKDNELKIIDIMVENVSMALTHRDEFSSVISQNGGKVEGLLKKLRSHIAEKSS
ncbi:MlaC/ttg2D family ABC transporter substrate-binding protein [Sneathiella glossodoripedis]|uniref:MlaC/ttg2D family ABC transporter substrate-binding protein n=1 Tax=Sneathiella glossodoripedis TaxID=418853 RepID=UPI0004724C2D|nr:ABC transporter substrate-binding protein [Sneathiella glossodoripedis]